MFWNTPVILAILDFLLLDQLTQLEGLSFAISIHPFAVLNLCYFLVAVSQA